METEGTTNSKYAKILIILLIGIAIFGSMLYYIFYNQDTQRSTRANAATSITLAFSPATVAVPIPSEFTTTVKVAALSTAFQTQGYAFKVSFDKTKVQLKSMQYKLGIVSAGLGYDNANIAQANADGVIKVQGEIPSPNAQLISGNEDVVSLIFAPVAANMTYGGFLTIESAGTNNFIQLNSDLTLRSVPVTGNTISLGTANGYQVSGQVLNSNGMTVTPNVCPKAENNPAGVNGQKVHLFGIPTGQTQEINEYYTSGCGGSYQPGAFYFKNVPNGYYNVCVDDLPASVTHLCSTPQFAQPGAVNPTPRDPFGVKCSRVLVSGADVFHVAIAYNFGALTPAICPGAPVTGTPAPSTGTTLKMRMKMQGITAKPRITAPLKVKVKLVSENVTTPISQDVNFTVNDAGIWEGTATVTAQTGNATKYSLYVKGPKHLKKRICTNNPTESTPGSYTCARDGITLNPGENLIDMSNIYHLTGDLPVDGGTQNGLVDSNDTSFVRLKFGSTDATNTAIGDLNLDGVIDTQDFSLIIAALNVKYDDAE